MRTRLYFVFGLALLCIAIPPCYAANMPDGTKTLLSFVQKQEGYQAATALNPRLFPTQDGKSFALVWQPNPKVSPKHWLVSLHGSKGTATRELEIWHSSLAAADTGLIALQWWFGDENYYRPHQIYRELEFVLRQAGVAGDHITLHGFSRGSANIYAVAAIDRVQKTPLFSLFVANSGGLSPDYPPNKIIGPKAYVNTRWVLSCGEKDPNPQRDGCQAMRTTEQFIVAHGGKTTMRIEDPNYGHGALNLNKSNTVRLLNILP